MTPLLLVLLLLSPRQADLAKSAPAMRVLVAQTNSIPSPQTFVTISWPETISYLQSTDLVNWSSAWTNVQVSFSLPVNQPQQFFRVQQPQQSVLLGWDASPDASVVGYNAYYGGASRTYTNTIALGNVTNTVITSLAPGVTYYFAVTAVDSSGMESDYSNEVSYSVDNQTKITINIQ